MTMISTIVLMLTHLNFVISNMIIVTHPCWEHPSWLLIHYGIPIAKLLIIWPITQIISQTEPPIMDMMLQNLAMVQVFQSLILVMLILHCHTQTLLFICINFFMFLLLQKFWWVYISLLRKTMCSLNSMLVNVLSNLKLPNRFCFKKNLEMIFMFFLFFIHISPHLLTLLMFLLFLLLTNCGILALVMPLHLLFTKLCVPIISNVTLVLVSVILVQLLKCISCHITLCKLFTVHP